MTREITRRNIQIVLGLLWLLDGVLQLQRQMFTSNFANQVIVPNAQSQPLIVRGPIHFAVHIILLHPAFFDACFALIQLSLGVLILYKRTAKYGLLGSIVWGLGVWYFGEGLGGLLTGNASLLMGAPGAALLYAVIALGVLPSKTEKKEDAKPAPWLAIAWVIIWLGGATLQLMQGQNRTTDLASMIGNMASGAPAWLGSLDHTVSQHLALSGNWIIAVLVIVEALIGILILLPHHLRSVAVIFGTFLALYFWVLGQGLGMYYSGLATDPNTAPLIILLGIAVLGSRRIPLNVF